ncbi:phosphomethylpyrimidine kinase [Aeromonas sp. YN13HZO-058]|uniref:thiamine phosphate synthase n=1 Tax=Aeromonas sp. YN13HZO-058 TaxID=1921564 RepID=UPI0009471134|nr:thiamine phosphate synthase [Aeromonas sp. YN13HZO-058]OLF22225.1 phosphomethylpyrimidine kinase [Aeromonas sp. YN13HZO-058]
MSSASGAVSPADLLAVTEARPLGSDLKMRVWTIAGSDSGGGAGIQADLHTLHDLGVHGCSVISAITAQNSVAVKMVDPVLMQTFTAQIDALGVDLPPAAIKIGLLPTRLHVEVLARRLATIEAPFVVYDPVAIASTGTPMAEPNMLEAVREQLLPRLSLITPNGPELEALTGLPVSSPELVRLAARRLRELGARAVLVKGGHLEWSGDLCLDYYQDETREFWLAAPRLDTRHGHGTGCCYASAIAAVVAQDYPVEDAITLARAYLQQGLAAAQGVGAGPGPIAHLGWPADLAHFPRAVLAGSTLDRRFGLFSVEGMEASCARLPDGPFAATEQHLGLYPVVDSVKWLRRLLGQGVKTIQLRIKNLPAAQVAPAIAEAVALGRRHGARLFINDYWQQAIEAGAWGVHLGQEDMETADLAAIQAAGLRLGISTHGYFELMRARELAPSYIALGHIFPTNTKAMPSRPQGLVRLHRYRALMGDWPTVAIGGISEERVAAVKGSGVGSIALVSAITASDDWQGATERLLAAVGAGDEPRSAQLMTDMQEAVHAL